MYYWGCKEYFRGSDHGWNIFDFTIVLVAWANIILEEIDNDTLNGFTIIRLIRLARLARLMHIFRMKAMKEFTLMIRGLFGGMMTLCWAILLLFFFVFILGVFMTELVGMELDSTDQIFQEDVVPLFGSLDMSMTTLFRCFTGDCSSATGRPLIPTMERIFGLTFSLMWTFVIMIIMFGLFNLIMAIYIENTLAVAKHQNESEKTRKKEAVRVAHSTRQLMQKFHVAQCEADGREAPKELIEHGAEIQDLARPIQKNTFLLVLQQKSTQKILDDLDVPSERARLFDVFDADGNGTLGVRELIQGLLRVRGEPQRSDVLAGNLGVRALLEMVRELQARVDGLFLHLDLLNLRFSDLETEL